MIYIIIFFILHWYMSLFSQTFFLHRYASHKMFTMTPFWEKFWYMFLYITQGSSYLVPRGYAIMHRMHHAYSDTEKDPHSPHFFKEVFTMMMETKRIYYGIVSGEYKVEEKFYKNYPVWEAVDKFGSSWFSRIGFGTLYTLFYIYFIQAMGGGYYWFLCLLLPIHYLMGPVHGAIVNWAGHKYGYRNWDEDDQSKNTLFWDLLMMGELFQNNHHRYGARANFANKWWEFDPTYPIIKLLAGLGIIKLSLSTAKW